MIVAILLSGGSGTRMGLDIPKQYLLVNNMPVIKYSYDQFINNKSVDGIIIVAHSNWLQFLKNNLDCSNSKFLGFAESGESRQQSILNGLLYLEKTLEAEDDLVIIHDSARPNISQNLINDCLRIGDYDGVLPVLPCKDTLYMSDDGKNINSLLNRDCIYAGQSPETFKYKKYLLINKKASVDELQNTRGSTEIAFKNGFKMKIISGEDINYKITTKNDFAIFTQERGKTQ